MSLLDDYVRLMDRSKKTLHAKTFKTSKQSAKRIAKHKKRLESRCIAITDLHLDAFVNASLAIPIEHSRIIEARKVIRALPDSDDKTRALVRLDERTLELKQACRARYNASLDDLMRHYHRAMAMGITWRIVEHEILNAR